MNPGPEDFASFFVAVNGYAPFPWQEKLVHEVVAHGGRWPAVLDLPTSAGKTSALDAAVYLLALEAGKPVHDRMAAVRTFFVVDRRIVVDEAGQKARKLAKLLNDPPADVAAIVNAVAQRLESFGGEKALHVSVLRGGMYRDGSWAESPTQPTICLSTVDQVGSRLLFRGYGVGPNQRAVHAGLVGNDALILVDEAHLSRPFIETLKAVEFYRSDRWAESQVKTPFQVCVMSATAGEAIGSIGPMADEDEKRPPRLGLSPEDRANETLKARLSASKRARLEEVRGGADDENMNRQAFAEKLADAVQELAAAPVQPTGPSRKANAASESESTGGEAKVIGVVVNRVDTARRVFQKLMAGRDAEHPTFDVILLTGRIRPYDRDRLLDEWFQFMEANKARPLLQDGKKLFLVATQTIECGANISLDALVSEVAPLDALRQRFGRLDRLGVRGYSNAIILARKDLLREEDPVYGDRAKATWDWLTKNTSGTGKNKRVDFGIDSFDTLLPTNADERRALLEALCSPFKRAPVMMPAHLDDLVQTTVPPMPDPRPELFLHGPTSGPADVSVVWRADITNEQLEIAADANQPQRATREAEILEIVALVPPVTMEALPVPIWAVRKWLAMESPEDMTDVEGEAVPPGNDASHRESRACRPFLRWKGPDAGNRKKDKAKGNRWTRSDMRDDQDSDAEDESRIDTEPRPGDTIIVPTSYGGCDQFGWNPTFRGDVTDVADDCSWRSKRRPVLRVHPASAVHAVVLAAWGVPLGVDGGTLANALTTAIAPDEDTREVSARAIRTALRSWTGLPEWLAKAMEEARGKPRGRELPYPDGSGRILLLPVQKVARDDSIRESEGLAEGDAESFPGGLVPLEYHCKKVQEFVERFANHLGLTSFRKILSRAALLHDAGKSDPRFQIWLYGSEAEAARHGFELIAKSSTDSRNVAAMERARQQARWPKHARHEALSVLLIRENATAKEDISDPALLVHLIGTHHGRGRPMWPLTINDELPDGAAIPEQITCQLDSFGLQTAGRHRPEAELTPFHAGWVDHFCGMVRKYGYWGLAYLESLIVLADHRQSDAEKEADV
jgi:CRISPR-associated endonuclease/helicase Cas3